MSQLLSANSDLSNGSTTPRRINLREKRSFTTTVDHSSPNQLSQESQNISSISSTSISPSSTLDDHSGILVSDSSPEIQSDMVRTKRERKETTIDVPQIETTKPEEKENSSKQSHSLSASALKVLKKISTNDSEIYIGSVTFAELKLRCIAEEHKYGYLTVDDFIEFGMRFGFENQPFVDIFITTYKSFMKPKQIAPQLRSTLDRLLPLLPSPNERVRVIERLCNLMYHIVDTNYEDFQFDVKVIADIFQFIGYLTTCLQENLPSVPENQETATTATTLQIDSLSSLQQDASMDSKRIQRLQDNLMQLCEYLTKRSSNSTKGTASAPRISPMFGNSSIENISQSPDSHDSPLSSPTSSPEITPSRRKNSLFFDKFLFKSKTKYNTIAYQRESNDSEPVLAPIPYTIKADISNIKQVAITEIHPVELARQLTILEFETFCKIRSEELLSIGWTNKESKEWVAPNISMLISTGNQVTDWIATSIVCNEKLVHRKLMLKYFIAVAEACAELNNFNTLFEIMHGLASSSVYRLKQTFEALPKPDLAKFKKLEEITSFDNNRKNYREFLKKILETHKISNEKRVGKRCLPYLGVHLTDLVFFNEGNENEKIVAVPTDDISSEPKMIKQINFTKRSLMSQVVKIILECQKRTYLLEKLENIQQFITWQLNAHVISDEKELFALSKQYEPSVQK